MPEDKPNQGAVIHKLCKIEERLRNGITDALLRLSIGIENSDDLLADFSQALNGK